MSYIIAITISTRPRLPHRSLPILAALALAGRLLTFQPAHADQLAAAGASATTVSYFNWVDHASTGMTLDNIHILNPGSSAASGRLLLPGLWQQGFTVPPGGEGYYPVPAGIIGGPLQVLIDAGPGVLASQRVVYQGTISEFPAISGSAALSQGYFAWYDLASAGMTTDNIHLLNPGSATSLGRISLPGAADLAFEVGPGEERYFSFPRGSIGGPLSFTVTSGPPLLASQRTAYLQSFTETAALSPATAAAQLFFNWYDRASAGMTVDDIHLINPGTVPAAGSISAPGLPEIRFSVAPGAAAHYSWPQGSMAGPVSILVTSGPPLLATQRMALPPIFSEWPALPAAAASTDSWFNWYDRSSPYSVDDVHLANPSPAAATATLSLPGQAPVTLTVGAGQDAHYSFPPGTIGGPIHIQVTSGPPLLTSHRAWLLPPPPLPTSAVLNVPVYHQHYELSCEEAALRMALAYQGIGVSEDQILAAEGIDLRRPVYDSAGQFHWGDPYAIFVGDPNGSEVALTGYGTYSTVIDRVATGFGGAVVRSGEGVAPADVYNGLLNGHPVVAWVSFDWRWHSNTRYTAFDGRAVQFGAPYEHAVTLVGVTPDAVLVNNPWTGQEWQSKATFEAAYATFNQMAVILR